MRIKCSNLGAFIANLEGATLYCGAIWAEVVSQKDSPTAHCWEVFLRAGAILDLPDGQALLECVEPTGLVNAAKNGTKDGQIQAEQLMSQLAQVAASRGWTVRPGSLDI